MQPDLNIKYSIIAQLLMKCAEAMDNEDKRRMDAGESVWHPVAGSPTGKGNEICEAICTAAGHKEIAFPIYLLLAYTWNDAHDWAKVHS
jgi:hypothetical protein